MDKVAPTGRLRATTRPLPRDMETYRAYQGLHKPDMSPCRAARAVEVTCTRFGNDAHGVYHCSYPNWRGAEMSEPRTPAEGAPSAESVKEHVKKTDQEKNLGAGNQEPDPATAENPPRDIKAGDEKRDPS